MAFPMYHRFFLDFYLPMILMCLCQVKKQTDEMVQTIDKEMKKNK